MTGGVRSRRTGPDEQTYESAAPTVSRWGATSMLLLGIILGVSFGSTTNPFPGDWWIMFVAWLLMLGCLFIGDLQRHRRP